MSRNPPSEDRGELGLGERLGEVIAHAGVEAELTVTLQGIGCDRDDG